MPTPQTSPPYHSNLLPFHQIPVPLFPFFISLVVTPGLLHAGLHSLLILPSILLEIRRWKKLNCLLLIRRWKELNCLLQPWRAARPWSWRVSWDWGRWAGTGCWSGWQRRRRWETSGSEIRIKLQISWGGTFQVNLEDVETDAPICINVWMEHLKIFQVQKLKRFSSTRGTWLLMVSLSTCIWINLTTLERNLTTGGLLGYSSLNSRVSLNVPSWD